MPWWNMHPINLGAAVPAKGNELPSDTPAEGGRRGDSVILLEVFVPGKLRNPLNGSWGGWRKHARLAKDWRERTAQRLFMEQRVSRSMPAASLSTPKRITFTAQVGARWDDDNLPAAIKPIRDALVGLVIHADDPGAGHEFVYRQTVNRSERGVRITVHSLFLPDVSHGTPPAH